MPKETEPPLTLTAAPVCQPVCWPFTLTPLNPPSPCKQGFGGPISQRGKLRLTKRLTAKDHRLRAEKEFEHRIVKVQVISSFHGVTSPPKDPLELPPDR